MLLVGQGRRQEFTLPQAERSLESACNALQSSQIGFQVVADGSAGPGVLRLQRTTCAFGDFEGQASEVLVPTDQNIEVGP